MIVIASMLLWAPLGVVRRFQVWVGSHLFDYCLTDFDCGRGMWPSGRPRQRPHWDSDLPAVASHISHHVPQSHLSWPPTEPGSTAYYSGLGPAGNMNGRSELFEVGGQDR